MDEMKEALAAIEGSIAISPDKIPAGKTVVAIKLDRDPATSGKYMVGVKAGWLPKGWAIAMKDGHVVAANAVYGHIAYSVPKVIACTWCECTKCGKREITPVVAWKAKKSAKDAGITSDLDHGISAMAIINRYGVCDCGGKWMPAVDFTKKSLETFTKEVLDSISKGGPVPKFINPRGFVVRPIEEAVDLGADWQWLYDAMGQNMRAALPASKELSLSGNLMVFNPGYWLGWVDHHNDSGLFFVEKDGRRQSHVDFNPGEIDGL